MACGGAGAQFRHAGGVGVVEHDDVLAGPAEALGEQALSGTPQSSGGEDFGWYLENVPGSFARLGVQGEGVQAGDLHHAGFVLDERALFVGVRTMVHTALHVLRQYTGGAAPVGPGA